jgi:purine nucleosidase
MRERISLILDVDTGIDDALAIALAVLSPEAELALVSTVAGNTSLENATRNTLSVLDFIGAANVPVHRGATRPLVRQLEGARHVHGDNGIGGASLPASQRATGSDRGPAAIIRMAFSKPGEYTLVCLGPLTNLAIALNVEPRLPEMLGGLVVMGGAYAVAGNVTPHAEFNIHTDPEAAAQVFGTDFRSFIAIGLDVTHEASLTPNLWRAANQSDSAAARLLVSVMWSRFLDSERPYAYLHDPMAVAIALDPSLVVCDDHSVEVLTIGPERGKTVLKAGTRVKVAKKVDAARFMNRFVQRFEIDPGEIMSRPSQARL